MSKLSLYALLAVLTPLLVWAIMPINEAHAAAPPIDLVDTPTKPTKKPAKPKRADLIVSQVKAPRSPWTQLTSFTISADVKNKGTFQTRGATSVGFYLSKNKFKDNNDRLLGHGTVGRKHLPGKTKVAKKKIKIPTSIKPGRYYLFACADVKKKALELNEKNNCKALKSRITIRVTDRCKNIPGYQGHVPPKLVRNGVGECVVPPLDVCQNVVGIQSEMPAGMFLGNDGKCVKDACANIDGNQIQVPRGLVKDEKGDCVPVAYPLLDNADMKLDRAVSNWVKPGLVVTKVVTGMRFEVYSMTKAAFDVKKYDPTVACEQNDVKKVMDDVIGINNSSPDGVLYVTDVPLEVYGVAHVFFYRVSYGNLESACRSVKGVDGFNDFMLDIHKPADVSNAFLMIDGSDNDALQGGASLTFTDAEILDPARTGKITISLYPDLHSGACFVGDDPDGNGPMKAEQEPWKVSMTAPAPGLPKTQPVQFMLTAKTLLEFKNQPDNAGVQFYMQTEDAAGNKGTCMHVG